MLAKALVFKALETLSTYEIDLKKFKNLPKYKAISKLEPLLYSLVDKKITNYSGCVNLAEARLYAKDFILFYINNYESMDASKPLFKLALKKTFKNKDYQELLKNKHEFYCLYFLKEGKDYKEKKSLEKDLADFMQKHYKC